MNDARYWAGAVHAVATFREEPAQLGV